MNDLVDADKNGPKLSGFGGSIGAANFWMVVNPVMSDSLYHKLGKCLFIFIYVEQIMWCYHSFLFMICGLLIALLHTYSHAILFSNIVYLNYRVF